MSTVSTDEIALEEPTSYDWPQLVADLNELLRLKTTPIGMKLFATVAEMEAIPKIRRPSAIHTTDQIVAQAARLGWTVGITAADLAGAQCGAVIGLHPQDDAGFRARAWPGSGSRHRTSAHRRAMARRLAGSAMAVAAAAAGSTARCLPRLRHAAR
jgi:uncharacterized protein (DUF169 family)